MPKPNQPRFGSMQYWPRKRARRAYPIIGSWPASKDANVLGFAGYKAGMTHLILTDNRGTSLTKGQEIVCPATIVECPPIKIAAINFYKTAIHASSIITTVFSEKLDKELGRRIKLPKKQAKKIDDVKEFDDLRLLAYTQPRLTGIGKKKPEIFELAVGGSKEQKLAFAKDKLGKEISVAEVFKEGQQIDIHAVSKGHGFQGPVRRFGIGIRNHKSEKSIRNPGSLGAWKGQGHMMYRVAHAGFMGYHARTEYNKQILKIGSKPEEVNPKGGFLNYGIVRNSYIIVKGSVAGTKNRMIRLIHSIRPNRKVKEAAAIVMINTDSKQGR
jgi:large subunit ribosomal protein L3